MILGCKVGQISSISDYGLYQGNSEADEVNLCASNQTEFKTELPDCKYLSDKKSKVS
jgi:hypothetical protein